MQAVALLLLITALTSEYLVSIGAAPSVIQFSPELLSLIAVIYVIVKGPQERFQNVRFAYWIVFAVFTLVMVTGVLVERVSPGPVFAGIRNFCAPVPFFFLPAVYAYTGKQVRVQLLVLLALCLVQLPIAYRQRMTGVREGFLSGDDTMGTMLGSGMLSVFLIAAASILTAFYMRKMLSLRRFLLLLALVLAPTTLNETKVTLFLTPIALLSVVYFGSQLGLRLRNLVACLVLVAAFSSVYIVVYDYFVAPRWNYGLMDFFAQEGRVEGYMYSDAEVGAEKAGRVDALAVPLSELSKSSSSLAFGLGLGNASDSALGAAYVGRYFNRFEIFSNSAASVFLLETGLIGLVCALLVLWLVFQDSRKVAAHDDTIIGALALGMTGVILVFFVCFFYTTLHLSPPHAYIFTFYCGLIAAHRMRRLHAERSMVGIRSPMENVGAATAT